MADTEVLCELCEKNLAGLCYMVHESKPYCVVCYESNFSNTCEECHTIIGIDCTDIGYQGHHWHDGCCFCYVCKRSLVDEPFEFVDETLYCSECDPSFKGNHCCLCRERFTFVELNHSNRRLSKETENEDKGTKRMKKFHRMVAEATKEFCDGFDQEEVKKYEDTIAMLEAKLCEANEQLAHLQKKNLAVTRPSQDLFDIIEQRFSGGEADASAQKAVEEYVTFASDYISQCKKSREYTMDSKVTVGNGILIAGKQGNIALDLLEQQFPRKPLSKFCRGLSQLALSYLSTEAMLFGTSVILLRGLESLTSEAADELIKQMSVADNTLHFFATATRIDAVMPKMLPYFTVKEF